MPKKAVRAKHKFRRTAKKQSFFDELFTFPKLALAMFVILAAIFVYQVFIPGRDVKGVSTIADTKIYSDSEMKAISQANPTSSDTIYFAGVRVFNDKNSNGKLDSNENCGGIGNMAYTKTFGSDVKHLKRDQGGLCTVGWIKLSKCKSSDTIKNLIKKDPISGYKITGYTLTDKTHKNSVMTGSTATVCGGEWAYNTQRAYVDFGLRSK